MISIEEFEKQGATALGAVLAAIDEVEPEHQIPMLRMAIDLGLERVAAAESAYFEFHSECVILAVENMQDVRLHDLEKRLERVEKPDEPSLKDVLVETAIILAVELGVVVGANVLIPAILIFAGSRILARSARFGARGILTKAESQARETLSALQAALASQAIELGRLPHGDQLLARTIEIHQRETQLVQQISILNSALVRNTSKADAISRAHSQALAEREMTLRSGNLRQFLEGAVGSTIMGRVGESSGQFLADRLTEAAKHLESEGGGTYQNPFLTSTIVGVILAHLRERRLEAELGHLEARLLLRNIEDSSFHDHPFAQERARGVFDAIWPLEAARAMAELARPLIVRGYEALLWYEWLRASGALRIEPGKKFTTGMKLRRGEVYNCVVVTKQLSTDNPIERPTFLFELVIYSLHTYEFEGNFYHACKITEHQTKYLFDTFAEKYYMIPDNLSQLPFGGDWRYDPSRYREVIELAERRHDRLLDNAERERRLDEMRVMVVTFFNHFFESIRAKVSLGAISDEVILVNDYLSTVPEPEIDPAASQLVESSPDDRTCAANALISATGFVEDTQFSDDLNRLEQAMTRLELNILTFELFHEQASYEAGDAVFGEKPEDAERQITDLQAEITYLYAALVQQIKDFASEQPDKVRTFEAIYQERMNRLTTWKKNDKLDLAWRWYGDPATPPSEAP